VTVCKLPGDFLNKSMQFPYVDSVNCTFKHEPMCVSTFTNYADVPLRIYSLTVIHPPV